MLAHEVEVLDRLLHGAARPFVAVLGGSKVSDKLGVIEAHLDRVDLLVVGGGMCFTFLAAQGHSVGASLLESDQVERCRQLLAGDKQIVIPSDVTGLSPDGSFGPGRQPTGEVRQRGRDRPAGWLGLNIGPGTAAEFADRISAAATVFWNGPWGCSRTGASPPVPVPSPRPWPWPCL